VPSRRRIGLGVAEAFLSSGASVSIISSTQASLNAATSLLLAEYPGSIVGGRTADVRDEDAIAAVLREFAPVDHIVYTAVDDRIRGSIGDQDINEAKGLFGVKFWGQVAVAKAIANHDIINPGGSYTITSGSLSLKPKPGTAVGAALNSAVNTLAQGLAIDLSPKKVRVNCVVPGFVVSTHDRPEPGSAREAFVKKASERPLLTGYGVGTTEDIAEAYLYFARAKFTTAQVTVVDGGALLVD